MMVKLALINRNNIHERKIYTHSYAVRDAIYEFKFSGAWTENFVDRKYNFLRRFRRVITGGTSL